jgi:hypothetical protein
MRNKDRNAQRKYYEENVYDEYVKAMKGETVPRDEVHEIVHGSRKTYEDWNMISLTADNHRLAHSGDITKKELFTAKRMSGSQLPEEIMREYFS